MKKLLKEWKKQLYESADLERLRKLAQLGDEEAAAELERYEVRGGLDIYKGDRLPTEFPAYIRKKLLKSLEYEIVKIDTAWSSSYSSFSEIIMPVSIVYSKASEDEAIFKMADNDIIGANEYWGDEGDEWDRPSAVRERAEEIAEELADSNPELQEDYQDALINYHASFAIGELRNPIENTGKKASYFVPAGFYAVQFNIGGKKMLPLKPEASAEKLMGPVLQAAAALANQEPGSIIAKGENEIKQLLTYSSDARYGSATYTT